MNKVRLLFLCVAFTTACNLVSAQIHLKIEAIPGTANTWGVYASICDNTTPSANTITGSGQVTIKYPAGLTLANLTNHAGTWAQNATVSNPSESPGKVYVSLGFLVDNPQIVYQPDTETLLFSFKLNGTASAAPLLIENGIDPFDQLPNSANSNPGNELTVLDFGIQPLGLYSYIGTYSGGFVSCGSPQDTTVINPPIDTTGGGDTTVINPPGDTTQQASGVLDLRKTAKYFALYPTPAYEWIRVKFLDPDQQGGTIRLFTLNGIAIGQIEKGQKDEIQLNINGLSSGLYLLNYEKAGKTLQRDKFLKQ